MEENKKQKQNKIEPIDLTPVLEKFEHSGSFRMDILLYGLCGLIEDRINSIIKVINEKND